MPEWREVVRDCIFPHALSWLQYQYLVACHVLASEQALAASRAAWWFSVLDPLCAFPKRECLSSGFGPECSTCCHSWCVPLLADTALFEWGHHHWVAPSWSSLATLVHQKSAQFQVSPARHYIHLYLWIIFTIFWIYPHFYLCISQKSHDILICLCHISPDNYFYIEDNSASFKSYLTCPIFICDMVPLFYFLLLWLNFCDFFPDMSGFPSRQHAIALHQNAPYHKFLASAPLFCLASSLTICTSHGTPA